MEFKNHFEIFSSLNKLKIEHNSPTEMQDKW